MSSSHLGFNFESLEIKSEFFPGLEVEESSKETLEHSQILFGFNKTNMLCPVIDLWYIQFTWKILSHFQDKTTVDKRLIKRVTLLMV